MKLRTYAEAYEDICGRKPEADADPGCVAAAHTTAALSERYRQWGYRIRPWRPAPKTPAAIKLAYGWEWDTRLASGWLDHPYKILRPDKPPVFVAEPYGISDAALVSLNRLAETGWSVRVDAWWALWFPGRTVAIWITKREQA